MSRRPTGRSCRVGAWLVVVGGVAITASTLLPWFTANFGLGPFNRDGLQSWDSSKVNIDGVVTVAVGSLTAVVGVLRAGVWPRLPARLPMVTAGAMGLLLAFRVPKLAALANQVGASYSGVSARVGYGVWVVCGGVLCAVVGGWVVEPRHRDVAQATLAIVGGGLIAVSGVMPWFTVDFGGKQFARNGFQLGDNLGFSVDGVIAVVIGLASMAVGVQKARRPRSRGTWAAVPLVAGLVALALVEDQLPSLELLGVHVTSLYGGGRAGPGFGLDLLTAGAGLAVVGGIVGGWRAGSWGRDMIFVGGLVVATASVLPWFSVITATVPTNLSGFALGDNGGWSTDGVISVVAGSVIVASGTGVSRRFLSGAMSVWLTIVGVLVASVLMAYRLPLLFARAHEIVLSSMGRHSGHVAYGVWLVVAGGAIAVLGCEHEHGGSFGRALRGRARRSPRTSPRDL